MNAIATKAACRAAADEAGNEAWVNCFYRENGKEEDCDRLRDHITDTGKAQCDYEYEMERARCMTLEGNPYDAQNPFRNVNTVNDPGVPWWVIPAGPGLYPQIRTGTPIRQPPVTPELPGPWYELPLRLIEAPLRLPMFIPLWYDQDFFHGPPDPPTA